jgi:lipopolysaccharide/colanic/teichoic acid biosynthesis glycosyltransferase
MYSALNRTLDVIGSIFGIIIFSPIHVMVAIAIKLDSSGPVLVEESDRVGRKGNKFRMYKFRSMVADAHVKIKNDPKFRKLYKRFEKNSFKLENDPRITRVGMFLRRTSLDELPQFFNVFMGNMSLVGPRALYPEELETRKLDYPDLRGKIEKALTVKPGITGPWQVSGRSGLDFKERINLDAKYAAKKSILFDLLILVKTFPAVIRGKGAK